MERAQFMGRIIVITSGKGGAGKSSVSCGCAVALARQGKKVLLVDADVGLRSLDVMLGVGERTVYHWEDILSRRCREEQAVVEIDEMLPLFLLAAPYNIQSLPQPEQFRDLCREMAKNYDFVLIDSPAGLGRGFTLAAQGADEALLVVTPDPVCIRAAGAAAARLPAEAAKTRMVLNRFKAYPILRRSMPNIDDAIDQTGVRLIGVVPEDRELTYRAAKGELLPQRCPAMKAFQRIACRLQGEEIPLKYLVKMVII